MEQNKVHRERARGSGDIWRCFFTFFLVLGLAPWAWGQTDLSQASLEELMNIEVTTVSRKEQKLSRVAAAIFVLTQEDIRRSCARNIPEVLRLVPGLDVAQVDANTWAISARGFNDVYANKLLVMIDGRSVYESAFGGVFWDLQDVPLEDVERIEVIRGPGATIWGANAMNGVINILTKSSKATSGAYLRADGGSQAAAQGLVQYDGKIGQSGSWRGFGKYSDEGNFLLPSGQLGADGWHMLHGGFRSDWELTGKDSLMLEGDLSKSGEGQTVTAVISLFPPYLATFNNPVSAFDGDILAHWEHKYSERSETSLQMYFDRGTRTMFGANFEGDTYDLDFKHHVAMGDRHDLVWGLGFRADASSVGPGISISMMPPRSTDNLFSSFLQDEVSLSRSLWLTFGSKFEHNSYTGFEYEPGARLLWSPSPRQAAWAAVSRAIRQPTLEDVDVRYNQLAFAGPGGLPTLVTVFGNPHMKSEELLAYEAGYRAQASRRISADLAAFYNVYDRLRSYEPEAPYLDFSPAPPHLVIPQVTSNKLHGDTYGAEFSSTLSVSNWWRLSPGYAWLGVHLRPDADSLDTGTPGILAGSSPRQQVQFRSDVDLPHAWEFDTGLYYTDRLTAFPAYTEGMSELPVPGHTRVDTRLSWRPFPSWELSVVGQNLLDARHLEFVPLAMLRSTEISRSVYGEIRWRFKEGSR